MVLTKGLHFLIKKYLSAQIGSLSEKIKVMSVGEDNIFLVNSALARLRSCSSLYSNEKDKEDFMKTYKHYKGFYA